MVFGGLDGGRTGIRWAPLFGGASSTTRAEFQALASALAIRAPLCVATDSSATVARVRKLVAAASRPGFTHDTPGMHARAPWGSE
eukprot:9678001-Alexandrium_andersonii.AAC.1